MSMPNLAQTPNQATGTTSVAAAFGKTPILNQQLIYVLYGNANSTGLWSIPTGWTLGRRLQPNISIALFYKTSAGTEGTVTSTVVGSTNSVGTLYAFSGTGANDVVSTVGSGTSGTATSGTFTPAAAQELLFVTACGNGSVSAQTLVSSVSSPITITPAATNQWNGWGLTRSGTAQNVTAANTGSTDISVIAATFFVNGSMFEVML